MSAIYSIILLIFALFLIFSMIKINTSESSEMIRGMNFVGVSAAVVLLAAVSGSLTKGSGAMQSVVLMESIGASFFVVTLAFFSIRSCGVNIPRAFSIPLIMYMILHCVGVYLPEVFGMHFITAIPSNSFFGYRTELSVFYYIDLCFFILISFLGFYITFLNYRNSLTDTNPGSGMMAWINLLPVLGSIPAILPLNLGYEVMPVVIIFCWAVMFIIVYRYRMFDSMKMARDDIIETIEDGFIVIDANDRILFRNEKAGEIFPQLNYEATQEDVIKRLKNNDKKELEKEGRIYQISLVPFYDIKTFKGTTIWINDKTEEHEFTQRLIDLRDEAQKANKAKSVFLANMSHEIRTPMNAIIGMTELILNDNINSKVEENANNIRNAANTLLSLINGILDFSKIETGKMESTESEYNLGLVLKEICNMTGLKLVDKNVELIVHVDETIPVTFLGDETHIRQIYTNILSNAVKYTKRGYIRLNVSWEKLENGAHVMVSIEDTGCGIRQESIPTLFESFQRADMIKNRTVEGTGLGLAICKRLVESMGGEIGVRSTYGIGSVFSFDYMQKISDETPLGNYDYIELPVDKEHEKKSFIAPLARILVVDDNITNIKVAQGILAMYQVRVDTALSGKECLEKVARNNYHMILMDQMMPEMDGIETTRMIRNDPDSRVRNMHVIALTANAISGTREMFLQNGFQEYISKPIALSAMEDVLKKFLPPEIIHYVDVDAKDNGYGNLDISLPGIDTEIGLRNYGNDSSRYLQILRFILDDGAAHVERIRTCIEDKNYKQYVFEVHALKGLMAGIGAKQLAEFAKLQEMAGREGRKEEIANEGRLLADQYEELLAVIDKVLGGAGLLQEEKAELKKEPLSWEEFLGQLHSLQGSLDMLEQSEAARKVDNLLTYPLEDGIRQQLQEVRKAIGSFDYDEASEMLNLMM